MAPSIDHLFDKSPALVFKASNGTTFGISRERASLSSVWRDMLEAGGIPQNSDPIQVEDKEEEMDLFLTALGVYGFETSMPSSLQDLKPSQLVTLLRLGDKYHSLCVEIFVQQEVWVYSRNGYFHNNKLETEDIVNLFYYADVLGLSKLLEISAKLSLQIKDLIEDIPAEMNHITRGRHLLSLYRFRQRWDIVKKKVLEEAASKDLASDLVIDDIQFFSVEGVGSLFSTKSATIATNTQICQPGGGKQNCSNCGRARGTPTGCTYCLGPLIVSPTKEKFLVLLTAAFQELTFDELNPPAPAKSATDKSEQ